MRRTPSQARSEKKVRQILDAARLVLVERGLEKFTTNHVAQKAGCNIGTLYRYFPDKNVIIIQMYSDWLARAMQVNIEAVQASDLPIDPARFVVSLFLHHLEACTEEDHRFEVELAKAVNLNKDLRTLDANYDESIIRAIFENQHLYSDYQFTADQIAYGFKLAISLLVMISSAEADQRHRFSDLAAQTLSTTIRGWYVDVRT